MVSRARLGATPSAPAYSPALITPETRARMFSVAGIPLSLVNKIANLSADQMWRLDETWAAQASKVDGRLCLSRPPRAYDSTCGGSPICNWAFLSVEKTCSAESFSNVMFQGVRYVWCQEKLAELLANKPTAPKVRGNRASANAWADWCISVMRLVSMANWATNMHPRYLTPLHLRPNAAAAVAEIRGALRATPTKMHGQDQIPSQDAFTMVMAAPAMLGVAIEGPVRVPTRAPDFDPVWIARGAKLTRDERPWPWERFSGRSPRSMGAGSVGSSRVRDALVEWFEDSMTGARGSGYWYSGRFVRARVVGTVGCGIGPSAYCPRDLTGLQHWWGAAEAQIRMCEAWAQDIIETSFGQLTADSIQSFLDEYEAIPESMRALSNAQIGEVRDGITERIMNEITAGISTGIGAVATIVNVVPIIGQVASAVIVIVGALVVGLLQILQAAGAMAFGGSTLESACLPPPVIRQIPSIGTDACDFDPRDGRIGTVAAMISAVGAAARLDLPIDVWFEASREASGEEGALPDAPPPPPPGRDGAVSPAVIALGVGGVALIGYVALRGKG